jgi:ribosome biogenesis protein ERB1
LLRSCRTSVPDKLLQQNTNLTDAELDIIRRLQNAENPDENYDPYAPTVEWFTSHEEVMPLSNRPEPKARFVASKWEHKKVSRSFPL